MHENNTTQAQQLYMHACVCVCACSYNQWKKEVMDLKEFKEWHMEGFKGRKGKENDAKNAIISKLKKETK